MRACIDAEKRACALRAHIDSPGFFADNADSEARVTVSIPGE